MFRKAFRIVRILFYLFVLYITIPGLMDGSRDIISFIMEAVLIVFGIEFCVFIWYEGKFTKRH